MIWRNRLRTEWARKFVRCKVEEDGIEVRKVICAKNAPAVKHL